MAILNEIKTFITEPQARQETIDHATAVVRGALKSWTIYLGMLVTFWPDISPAFSENFSAILGEGITGNIVRFMGITVMLLRLKTNMSLAAKGAK